MTTYTVLYIFYVYIVNRYFHICDDYILKQKNNSYNDMSYFCSKMWGELPLECDAPASLCTGFYKNKLLIRSNINICSLSPCKATQERRTPKLRNNIRCLLA